MKRQTRRSNAYDHDGSFGALHGGAVSKETGMNVLENEAIGGTRHEICTLCVLSIYAERFLGIKPLDGGRGRE